MSIFRITIQSKDETNTQTADVQRDPELMAVFRAFKPVDITSAFGNNQLLLQQLAQSTLDDDTSRKVYELSLRYKEGRLCGIYFQWNLEKLALAEERFARERNLAESLTVVIPCDESNADLGRVRTS